MPLQLDTQKELPKFMLILTENFEVSRCYTYLKWAKQGYEMVLEQNTVAILKKKQKSSRRNLIIWSDIEVAVEKSDFQKIC